MCFNQTLAYLTEYATYAILFREVHGWDNALWPALGQTAGDVIAAVVMSVAPKLARHAPNQHQLFEERGGVAWLLASIFSTPYQVTVLMLSWVLLSLGMAAPSLAVCFTSQVLMGVAYVFGVKLATEMNVFYSKGDAAVFLRLQVLKDALQCAGGALATFGALTLYEALGPQAPYIATACVSGLIAIIFTFGFCQRVGFGKPLETLEASRANRKSLEGNPWQPKDT